MITPTKRLHLIVQLVLKLVRGLSYSASWSPCRPGFVLRCTEVGSGPTDYRQLSNPWQKMFQPFRIFRSQPSIMAVALHEDIALFVPTCYNLIFIDVCFRGFSSSYIYLQPATAPDNVLAIDRTSFQVSLQGSSMRYRRI